MLRRSLILFLLLAGETGAVLLLLKVPGGALGELPSLAPEDAVVASVRVIALLIAGWLTASTILYAIASATRLPALVRGVRWVTLPGVRRLVDGVVATTVVATSTLGITGTASAMPPTFLTGEARTPAAGRSLYVPRPAGDPLPREEPVQASASSSTVYQPHPAGGADPPEAPAENRSFDSEIDGITQIPAEANDRDQAIHGEEGGPPAPPIPVAAPTPTYVMRAGDHLWSVATGQVAMHTGKPAAKLAAREIARYWVRLIDLNTQRLRSGDPNVVYPGETVLLPEPPGG
jgi:hypothetical protein